MLKWPHVASPLMVIFLFLALALDSWFLWGSLFLLILAVMLSPSLENIL